MSRFLLVAMLVVAVTSACSDATKPVPRGFEIAVAPLDLPDVLDTCYRATVFNTTDSGLYDAAHTVWSQAYICATQYGDGLGSVTYIGTCDADGGTPENPVLNTVELELQAILVADEDAADLEADDPSTPYDETKTDTLASPGDFFNPCQAPNYCRLQRPCVENQDTLVEFNLTVMRSARQGFFDIAVNFEDIFCSAKFDCQYPDIDTDGDEVDEAIKLIFDANGERTDTAVLGFACTAGEATALQAGRTYLYMDDIRITCEDETGDIFLDDNLETWVTQPGNQLASPRPSPSAIQCDCDGDGANNSDYFCILEGGCDAATTADTCDDFCGFSGSLVLSATCTDDNATCASSPVVQYGVYQGNELVDADFEKVYWNVAIGFNIKLMAGLECTLSTKASASDAIVDEGGESQGLPFNETLPGTVYPYLTWNINLNDPANAGSGLTCGRNAIGPGPAEGQKLFYSDSGVRPHYTQLPDETVWFDNCGHDFGDGFETFDGACGEIVWDN